MNLVSTTMTTASHVSLREWSSSWLGKSICVMPVQGLYVCTNNLSVIIWNMSWLGGVAI